MQQVVDALLLEGTIVMVMLLFVDFSRQGGIKHLA